AVGGNLDRIVGLRLRPVLPALGRGGRSCRSFFARTFAPLLLDRRGLCLAATAAKGNYCLGSRIHALRSLPGLPCDGGGPPYHAGGSSACKLDSVWRGILYLEDLPDECFPAGLATVGECALFTACPAGPDRLARHDRAAHHAHGW